MNIENAKKLVSQLERLPDQKFYMAMYIAHPEDFHYSHVPRLQECGTVACIAGWASLGNGGPTAGGLAVAHWAEQWLGLHYDEASYLFSGAWSGRSKLARVTRADAIEQLNRMIAEAEAS